MKCVTGCLFTYLRWTGRKLQKSPFRIQLPERVTFVASYSGYGQLIDKYKPGERLKGKPLQKNQFSKEEAVQFLSSLSEEEEKRLQILKLEYEVWSSEGFYKMPLEMKDEWWASIFNLDSAAARKKLYKYYCKIDTIKRAKEFKKAQKPTEVREGIKTAKNTIFMKIYPATERKIYDAKLAQSMLFGRPLIIDMSYEAYMNNMENNRCLEQLLEGFSLNRRRVDPNDLILTGWIPDSYIYKKISFLMQKRQGTFNTLMWKTTNQHYLDLYPRDRLVYLSPHSPYQLQEDHPDNIYIIGGYVDMVTTKETRPVSHARAKSENIRCYKLPLDRYVRWKLGTKSLTVNQTMGIMFDFMDTKNWNKALDKNLPKRKILLPGEEMEYDEDIIRARKMKSQNDYERYKNLLKESESIIKVRTKHAGKGWKKDFY